LCEHKVHFLDSKRGAADKRAEGEPISGFGGPTGVSSENGGKVEETGGRKRRKDSGGIGPKRGKEERGERI
jgi:hypothetical protein